MNVGRIKDAINGFINVVSEEIPGLEAVNCKELVVAFKEDVPPLVSKDGITLHLPDIVEEWESSERLVTWGELFKFDGVLEDETGTSEQLRFAIVSLVKSKEFQHFIDTVMDEECRLVLEAYKSVRRDEQGGEGEE